MMNKEFKKTDNYSALQVELARLWNTEAEVVPSVIKAFGSIPKKLLSHINELATTLNLQKSSLPGTANIFQKVLSKVIWLDRKHIKFLVLQSKS